MFENLKEKISGFRSDVDEEVTDEVEDEVEEEHGDSDDVSLSDKARTLVGERSFIIEESDLEAPLEELEMGLLSNDVEIEVAKEIMDGIRSELIGEKKHIRESKSGIIEDALRTSLLNVMTVEEPGFRERLEKCEEPVVIIFTGVNGVGKTTTIAKVAERLEQWGYSSVLANGDTFRAGANEQIEQHAESIGKKLIKHEKGGDPTAVIYDAVEYAEANDVDVVLGDTAGRLHTSDDLMNQLEKIERVVEPDMVIFVDEAIAGQDVVKRAREFNDAANIDGVILTKADADSQGGAALSISHVTGKPIFFLGTGQEYGDLERFDPEEIVDELLG